MTPSRHPAPNPGPVHALPFDAEPVRYRPPWRWVAVVVAGYIALAGTSFSPTFDRHAATPTTGAVAPGTAHGIAVGGLVATAANVPSDVRHG